MKKQKQLAGEFIDAIKTISKNENNLENFESYLQQHFTTWLKKFANTPESITAELKAFATMQI